MYCSAVFLHVEQALHRHTVLLNKIKEDLSGLCFCFSILLKLYDIYQFFDIYHINARVPHVSIIDPILYYDYYYYINLKYFSWLLTRHVASARLDIPYNDWNGLRLLRTLTVYSSCYVSKMQMLCFQSHFVYFQCGISHSGCWQSIHSKENHSHYISGFFKNNFF